VATVLGYLAEGVAYHHPEGLHKLLAEAGLSDGPSAGGSGSGGGGGGGGAGALIWRVRAALLSGGEVANLRAAKERVGEAAGYGQIKVR
jgi:hypothetical protein